MIAWGVGAQRRIDHQSATLGTIRLIPTYPTGASMSDGVELDEVLRREDMYEA
jgi:hypothetical protein